MLPILFTVCFVTMIQSITYSLLTVEANLRCTYKDFTANQFHLLIVQKHVIIYDDTNLCIEKFYYAYSLGVPIETVSTSRALLWIIQSIKNVQYSICYQILLHTTTMYIIPL